MSVYIDYLLWRGDLSFQQVPPSVVDAMLLSQLSYLDLNGVMPEGLEQGSVSLVDASKKYWQLHTEKELSHHVSGALRKAGYIMKRMAETKRFASARLTNWVCRFNADEEEQFAAVEIELTEQESFLSFCGTDDTLVGWKEDFNMSFLMPIPAQADALRYAEQVASHNDRDYYIGGHSKGGNLAVYAGVRCSDTLQNRIRRIYNFDGPGFSRAFIDGEDFQKCKHLIETWVPESSVVGMLFEHAETYQVVKSKQNAILAHEVVYWEVLGNGFCTCERVKKSSLQLARGVRKFLEGLTKEELRSFCDGLYEVLTTTNATTLADLNEDRWKSFTGIIKSYGNMDKTTKRMLYTLFKAVITSTEKRSERA